MTKAATGNDQPANLSAVIAPFLPYLRRHARSLCGTQTAGDGLVAQSLEALIRDRDAMDHSLAPRVGLYRLFHAIWNSTNHVGRGGGRNPAFPADVAADCGRGFFAS